MERRILALDQQENDYFVKGMQTAVRKAEAAGLVLPPMDFEKYAVKKEEPQDESQEEATEPSSEPPAAWVTIHFSVITQWTLTSSSESFFKHRFTEYRGARGTCAIGR